MAVPGLNDAGFAAIVAASLGAGGAVIAQWVAKWMERKRPSELIVAGYDSLVKRLEARITAAEKTNDELWTKFREMQNALFECEQAHLRDELEIRNLKSWNADQARRMRVLERRIPEIDSDSGDDGGVA